MTISSATELQLGQTVLYYGEKFTVSAVYRDYYVLTSSVTDSSVTVWRA